jgi:hypothetical protein
MPVLFINPARKRRRAKKARGTFTFRGRSVAPAKNPSSRRKKTAKRKDKKMARRLYGAAAKAHAKKLSKMKRRKRVKNPSPKRRRRRAKSRVMHAAKRRARRPRRRKNPSSVAAHYHSGTRGYAAGFKKFKRSAAARKGWRSRRAKGAAKAPRKHRAAAAPRKRRYKRRPGAKRRTGLKTLARARRTIKRVRRRKRGLAYFYVKRHRMRSNRSNPGLGGMMDVLKKAVPVAASLYLTRFIINKVSPMIPGVDKLGAFSKPAVSAGMVVAAHFGTRKGPLVKWRDQILLGTSLNLVDSLMSAFAPADVRGMFGLGAGGLYDNGLSEYVETGDYLQVGAQPIDDDIALSDYVTVSGAEEELGMLEQELGVEEDLGDDRLGGVSRGSMLRAVPSMSFEAPVPTRSFTRQVQRAGGGYDNPNVLYTGIFADGLGR